MIDYGSSGNRQRRGGYCDATSSDLTVAYLYLAQMAFSISKASDSAQRKYIPDHTYIIVYKGICLL